MKYAIIENRIAVNITVSETALESNWIQSDAAKIGDIWDGENFSSPTKTLDEQKEEIKNTINSIRDERFWSNVVYGQTSVQFRDSEDRDNITNLAQKADRLVRDNTPTVTVPLILEDDSIAQIEAGDFVTLSDSIMSLKAGTRVFARVLKNRVRDAANQTALHAIDIDQGWPS